MRANELMVGDWLNSKKGFCQINSIYLFTVIAISGDEAYKKGAESTLELDTEFDISPISITEEILLANDFTKQPDVPEGCVNWVYNNGGQIVYISRLPWDSFSIDANFHGRLSMQIQYVHELQHILRLIGINDLADNFKIA